MRITCVHRESRCSGAFETFVEAVATIRAGFPEAHLSVVAPADPAFRAMRVALVPDERSLRCDLRILRSNELVYFDTLDPRCVSLAPFTTAKLLFHIVGDDQGLQRAACAFARRAGAKVVCRRGDLGSRRLVIPEMVEGASHPRPMTYDGRRPLNLLAFIDEAVTSPNWRLIADALQALPIPLRRRLNFRILSRQAGRHCGDLDDRGLGPVPVQALGPGFLTDGLRWADLVLAGRNASVSMRRPLIEALSWGRPIVACGSEAADVVHNGVSGWVVAPRALALAEVLESAIERPETWQSYPATARRHFATVFKKEKVAALLVTTIQSLLDQQSRRQQKTSKTEQQDREQHQKAERFDYEPEGLNDPSAPVSLG